MDFTLYGLYHGDEMVAILKILHLFVGKLPEAENYLQCCVKISPLISFILFPANFTVTFTQDTHALRLVTF